MAKTPLTSRLLGVVAGCALTVGLGACGSGAVPDDADLIAGKQAFVKSCGSCHVLNRANTKGTVGPNLDVAFQRSLSDGLGRGTVRGVVHEQILFPARLPTDSPAYMPPKLVEGQAAVDVASYVASVAALPGEDTGRLGSAIAAPGAGKTAVAKDGKLVIAADPNGQLAYVTKKATANPGPLEIDSPNESSVPHDIAIDDNGVSEDGKDVVNGGVSTISFTAKAGTYEYFCTLPGHREAGMEGVLTVK